jgi:hypothetical protein
MADQQAPYNPGVDPLEALLRRAPLNDRQRNGLWQMYEASANADDLKARLSSVQIPDQVKEQLFVLMSQETAPVPKETQTAQGPQGSAVGRFASNAWEMVNPINIATGLYNTVRHPVETGKAILSQSAEQLSKAGEAASQGRYLEAVGHTGGAIPIVGPLAAEAGEQIAQGDIAGGFGKATGMLVPFGVARGVAKAGVKAAPAAAAEALEAGAASRYADVMSPKSSAAKGQRMTAKAEKIAQEIAKDTSNAAWSRQGLLDNFESRLQQAGVKLDDAADARNAGKPIDTKPVIDALRAKRAELSAQPFDATHTRPEYRGRGARTAHLDTEFRTSGQSGIQAADVPPHQRGYRTLDDVGEFANEPQRVGVPLGKEVVPKHNRAQVAEIDAAIAEIEALGPMAPYEALRVIRASYDKPAQVKYSPAVTPDYLANQGVATGAADVAGVIRETLANADPVTAAANADYALARSARDITKAAQELEKARPRTGRQIMAKLTGSIIGGSEGGTAGAVAGYAAGPVIDQLMSSGFTTKLQTAKVMQELANAIRSGDVQRASSLSFRVRQLAKQAEAVRSRGSVDQTATLQPAQ